MKKTLRAALAAGLSFMLASSPGSACCDDVWSCAGAVVSGGLTCAIELALDGLKSLLDRATRDRDGAAKDFDDGVAASVQETKSALEGWRQSGHAAATDAAASARKAADLVNEDQARLRRLVSLPAAAAAAPAAPGAGTKLGTSAAGRAFATATPTPVPPFRIASATGFVLESAIESKVSVAEAGRLLKDDSPEQLRREIEREKANVEGKERASVTQIERAREAADQSAEWSRASFAATFLVGMTGLITVIRDGISSPLGAVAALASAVAAISAVEKGLADLQPLLDQEAGKRADLADAPRPDVDSAWDHARRARNLLAKLEKILRFQTLLERQAEFKAPLLATTPAPSVRARMLAPARIANFTKSLRQRVGALRTDAQKLTLVRAPDVAPFRAKVSADLAARFRGKTPAAADATRTALLAEARRRFAFDPKTLAGVEKLITDASKAR